jgi:transposase
MAGRKSKLTPETQERIVQAIRVGATYELAAQFGGIAYNTFNEWMKAGAAAEKGVKHEFYEAIKAAEGEAAIKWLALIDKAAVDTWQAAAWKLERRYPENYGRQVQDMRHTGAGGGPVEHVHRFADMSDGELERLLK